MPRARSTAPPTPSLPARYGRAAAPAPVDGGFVVDGRWSFASGIRHSAWWNAGCLVVPTDGGAADAPRPPAPDGELIDNWDVGACAAPVATTTQSPACSCLSHAQSRSTGRREPWEHPFRLT